MDKDLLKLVIDEVDELLTDTNHAVDEQHARKLSLMLQRHTAIAIQDIYTKLNVFDKLQGELLVNLEQRRAVINERVTELERGVKEVKDALQDYQVFKKAIMEDLAKQQAASNEVRQKSIGVWVRNNPKQAAALIVAFVVLMTAAPEFWRVLAALAGFPIQLLP